MKPPTTEKTAPLKREHGKADKLHQRHDVNRTAQALAQLLRNGFDARRRRYETAAIRKGKK